eukprot:scaffold616259_cov39-Prasinocladus_malaysianus.AAC.1
MYMKAVDMQQMPMSALEAQQLCTILTDRPKRANYTGRSTSFHRYKYTSAHNSRDRLQKSVLQQYYREVQAGTYLNGNVIDYFLYKNTYLAKAAALPVISM